MLRARCYIKRRERGTNKITTKPYRSRKKPLKPTPILSPRTTCLAVYHWDRREKNQALASIDRVLELDPDNIEALKLRDRIQSMTTAEIAAYKTTDIATATYNVGVRTFNITRLIIAIVLLPLHIALFPMRIMSRLFLGK